MQGTHSGTYQPKSHDRLVAPWAGPGRVVGTALGRVLLTFLAGEAWDDSPGTLVQGSWGPHLEAEGRGYEPRWWLWCWSRQLQRES